MVTGETRRVNVSTAGTQSNSESIWPSISGNGQTVTFCSRSSLLVTGDTNGNWDLFAHDIATSATSRLNLQPSGIQADSYVRSPTALSTDGRFVIFASLSTNLVAGDTNGFQDVFLRDRTLQKTEMLSFAFNGAQTNDDNFVPHMTPDVRVITYTSEASDIVSGDTNGFRDIFASDLGGGSSTVYCTAKTNSLGCIPTISGTGNPSATNSGSFDVSVSQVRNGKAGLFFYKPNGAQASTPFQGGTLCVGPSGIRRTPATNSGGNPPPGNDCSGVYTLDFNAFAAGLAGGNPAPELSVPGNTYQAQAWGRDQGFPSPNNTTLSDGIDVTIGA